MQDKLFFWGGEILADALLFLAWANEWQQKGETIKG